MSKNLFSVLALMLAACSTVNSTNYDNELQKWVGASQSELMEAWGHPDNVFYLTPSRYVITYVKIDNGPIDGQTDPYTGEVYYPAIETPNYDFPSNGSNNMYYCKTSFTIANNQVIDYTFNGDDCVAARNDF